MLVPSSEGHTTRGSGGQSAVTSGSATQTEPLATRSEQRLRLVGEETRPRQGVTWTEDTVDNEHLNRKKSKICCIYHAEEEFGQSSEEEDDYSSSSSSSSSDSDSDQDMGSSSNSNKEHNCTHHRRRRHRPNAYERMPRRRN